MSLIRTKLGGTQGPPRACPRGPCPSVRSSAALAGRGEDGTRTGRAPRACVPASVSRSQGPAVRLALVPAGWGDRGQVAQPPRPHLSNGSNFYLMQLAGRQCDDHGKASNTGWVYLSETPLFSCRLLIWVGEGETGSLVGGGLSGGYD